jgi:hypothetical protein
VITSHRLIRPFVILLALGLLVAVFAPLATRSSRAGQQSITLAPGDTLTILCSTSLSGTVQGTQSTVNCAAPPATPTNVPPKGPVVTGFNGAQEGGTLSGKANIEALVTGQNIARVDFNLTGPQSTQHTEKTKPYYFLGDDNGTPRGWDTTKYPNGDYTLTATAFDSAGLSGTLAVHFHVHNHSATPVPGEELGVCGERMDVWHPPVINGCATGHEHGDAPPSWIAAAGYNVSFHGHFNTSPTEHTAKHAAMKGFTARFSNADIYFRVHAAANVLDRSARFHSYEVWARDPSGAVSHWQGWYNTGDPERDRYVRRQGTETSVRPAMLVVDQTSWDQGIRCEQWYALTSVWSWDFGWTICNTTTLYYAGENQEQDRSFWRLAPDGSLGGTRRLEAAWYSSRSHPTGAFVATQFGEIVSGMNDPRCSATTTTYGKTYQNVCLEQYIAPTMTQVAFPGNAVQKNFDTTGAVVPN